MHPALQTTLVRFTQIVSSGHTSPLTQGSRKDFSERGARWTLHSGPEKRLETDLLERVGRGIRLCDC